MQNRDPEIYLEDIKSAISNIEKYTSGMSFDDFEKDEKTTDAVIRNLEIIGEAVNNLPDDFKKKNNDIPWRYVISMRNKMIHEYFGVDLDIVWKTIQEDIKEFKDKIEKMESTNLTNLKLSKSFLK